MNLENILAVSGHGGLFKLVATRKNGLVAEHLETQKKSFFPTRKYQYTPLNTVAIYTYGDAVDLKEVFTNMREIGGVPSPKSSSEELRSYFSKILPDHDEDRVMISDIRKIIKWFNFIDANGLFLSDEEE